MVESGPDGRLWPSTPRTGSSVVPGTNSHRTRTRPRRSSGTPSTRTSRSGPTARSGGRATTMSPASATDWRGRHWTPKSGDPAAHPNSRFTVPAVRCPTLSPQWQAPEDVDQRHPLRRAPASPGPAGVPGVQLAARHVPGGDARVRDDGSGDRRGRRRARPHGDAAVLRLQHGGLLGALAGRGEAPESAEGVPHQLVPPERRGALHLAGLRRDLRVLRWIIERCRDGGQAEETAIGYRPTQAPWTRSRSWTSGWGHVGASPRRPRGLADRPPQPGRVLQKFGDRLPRGIRAESEALGSRLRVR